jgi:poly-gamma-glutamate capsule biosynthesis protein CapA/YwtB (metallophosphatase superfamily)
MFLEKQKKTVGLIGVFVLLFLMVCFLPVGLYSAKAKEKPAKKSMTLAALGDIIMFRKLSVRTDPAFLELVKIIRSADCTWANCELPIVDPDKAYHEYRAEDLPGFTYPWVADEFRWLGIDLVGFANNHTMDFGREGMFASIENLNRVGISYAGAGKDLEAATCPGYADTPGGRIGQVSCTSAYHPGTLASMPNPHMKGRPGLNPLGVDTRCTLPKKDYEELKRIQQSVMKYYEEESGFQSEESKEKEEKEEKEKETKKNKPKEEKEKKEEMEFLKIIFEPGDKIDYYGVMKEKDLKRITDAVKIARRNSQIVIVSLHAHWGRNKQTKPAFFIETFARACVDAGADVVFNTGPHRVWGIEIYKNKPIFYSLGNFVFHLSSDRFPAEVYERFKLAPDTRDGSLLEELITKTYFSQGNAWESFVPVITFEEGNKLAGIKLYPVWLGQNEPIYRRGSPVLADKKNGKAIIEDLAERSAFYKTKVVYREREGIGEITF